MRGARLVWPCWAVDDPGTEEQVLLALPDLLPQGSVLVLEERSMAREIRRAIEPYLVEPSLRIARQTLFPRSRQHHLPLTPELAQLLAREAEAHAPAAPRLCDHLSAYLDPEVLLEWHDAFCGDPILLSRRLGEPAVRRFAARLSVRFEDFPA